MPDNVLWAVDRGYANSAEARAITLHAMLSGQAVRYTDSAGERTLPLNTTVVPVGSVEYVRRVAKDLFGAPPPEIPDYPQPLHRFLGREVRRMAIKDAPDGAFVKPVSAKRFDVIRSFDHRNPPDVPPDTECWVCEPVRFREEYRIYVLDHEAIGIAQYDLYSRDRDLSPEDLDRIAGMITLWDEQPAAWALDVGFVSGGDDLLLVETNDGWATGYYPAAMPPGAYAEWLLARWREISLDARRARAGSSPRVA